MHLIPILCMSFFVRIDGLAVCDANWDEVTMTINCEGDFNFSINNPNVLSMKFAGYVGGVQTSFWPLPVIHAANTYPSGSQFALEILCQDSSKHVLKGDLPAYNFMMGNGAGTYTFSGPDTAGVSSGPTNVPSAGSISLSANTVNPTCASPDPMSMDGQISITINNINLATNCSGAAVTVTLTGGTIIGSEMKNGIVGQTLVFTGLGEGTYTASAVVTDPGCPCMIAAIPNLTPIILVGPTLGTTSLACNARINKSISQNCSVTITAMEILRGVTDPCDPMMAMIDSIVVKAGGAFVGGSGAAGLGVFIPDVRNVPGIGNILGQELKVEVIDEESGNLCWGHVILEDKSPPVITCSDPGLMEILCLDLDGTEINDIISRIIAPSECSDFTIMPLANPTEIPTCDDTLNRGILRRIKVNYKAVDEFGNQSEDCMDTIDVLRFDTIPGNDTLDVPGCILMPPDFILNPQVGQTTVDVQGNTIKWPSDNMPLTCTGNYAKLFPDDPDNPAPAPIKLIEGGSGFPILQYIDKDNMPADSYLVPFNYKNASDFYKRIIDDNLRNCSIGVDFDDLIFDFGCKIKIQRQWFLREWYCDVEQVLPLGMQEIIVTDFIDPFFTETVPDMVFPVDGDECHKTLSIPKPVAEDSCDTEVEIEIAIYDVDDDNNWNLIGPVLGGNGEPLMVFDFPVGMSFIVYTAFDDCGNSASDTTKITVEDTTDPVPICKEYLVIGMSSEENVRLPVTSINNGSYDQCELDRVCVVRKDDLELLDFIDRTDGLPVDGKVFFDTYDVNLQNRVAAGEGCYRDYFTSSFVLNGRRYISRESICTPYVDFCCADLREDNVMVEMRAIDAQGNDNACWTFVELQDKNPAIITCPPNITIDCKFDLPDYDILYFDLAEDPLSALFGSIVPISQQKAFGIPDEYILSSLDIDYVDGTIFDVCGLPNLSVRIFTDLDNCGVGTIVRQFYSDETGEREVICNQYINVERSDLVEGEDIVYPEEEINLTGCMTPAEIINQSFGEPEIIDEQCSLIGVSVENQVFLFNTQDDESDACFKIVRTFTLIDWCRSTTNGTPFQIGRPFKQIIKVNDPDGPVITCADDVIQTTTNCDDEEVMLMASATDECTEGRDHRWSGRVELDLDGDGIFETFDDDINIIVTDDRNMSKATHTARYPIGKHRITWTVFDRCGNSSSCVQMFEVVNNKKPTPFAIDIATVLMNTGPMVEVWASDLGTPSEQPPCPGIQLLRSMVRTADAEGRSDGGFGISQPALTFTCADVGQEGVDVNYFLYFIAGGEAIFDWTTVNIRVQDNNEVCNSVTSAFISGNVTTVSKESIPNIEVAIKNGSANGSMAAEAAMTNERGDYAFPAMPQGGTYVIDPGSSDDYLNGVTTLDLVLIQKHILGLQSLDSPFKIIAADINNDRAVTGLDLVDMRRVILGFSESFTNNESWRFIDENYTFEDDVNPLTETFNEFYFIDNLSTNMDIDFLGLKVGDVNSTVDAASVIATSRSQHRISTLDQEFENGDLIEVNMTSVSSIQTIGLQMSLSFDTDIIQFVGIEARDIDISSEHIGTARIKEGILSLSWSNHDGVSLNEDGELYTLLFKARNTGTLSDVLSIRQAEYLNAEIYDEDHTIYNLDLKFDQKVDEANSFVLHQNMPNPFAENTLISFHLPEASMVTMRITDVTGRIIKNYTGSFDKGNNYIAVSKDELSVSGVLYYTLATDKYTATRRMVVLK